MNTIERLATIGITIEVSVDTAKEICKADKFLMTKDEYFSLTPSERYQLRTEASDVMDAHYCGNLEGEDFFRIAEKFYWSAHEWEDEKYREENMEKFLAYEKRMNEPDFDWDYYSDWHKDMFGYRPHFRAIPATEEDRSEMCNTWHRARGL